MCYDISFSTSIELVTKYLPELNPEFARLLDLEFQPADHFLGQAFPTLPILLSEDGQLVLKAFEWGLVAAYMNTPELIKKNRNWMLNARSEKLLDKKAYWYRVREQRCVVPCSGFFEHREIRGMKNKVPYYIRRRDQPAMFIAGIYNYAPVPATGEMVGTFAILTRGANALMQAIHNGGDNSNRMPLILENHLVDEWLKPALSDQEIQRIVDYAVPVDKLEAWPVYSVRARSARPDGLSKCEPFDYAGLPGLEEEAVLKL